MFDKVRYLIFILLAFLLTAFTYPKLEILAKQKDKKLLANYDEVLYLPNGTALQALSFDYKTLLANILWFNTVSYFGKHYRGDRNYTWLNHMCNLVVDLDPHAEHVYEFCGLMLAWESEDAPKAIKILDKAIKADPEKWRYYYLRGITQALFLHDNKAAQSDFAAGAATPNAPIFMTRMASKTLSGLDSPESAIGFLKSMVARSGNPTEKAALEKHLKQTIHDYNLDRLEAHVKEYRQQHLNFPEKLEQVVNNLSEFKDPFLGEYYWDNTENKVKSTSGVARGKSLVKKTAKN